MTKQIEINIEYCGAWGYEGRFRELRSMILREVPEAQVEGRVGRRSSFEVTINKNVIYSKLAEGAFPKFESVVEEVVRARKGEEVQKVTEKQESSCTVL